MIVATFVDMKLEMLPCESVVAMQLNESAGDPW